MAILGQSAFNKNKTLISLAQHKELGVILYACIGA
jgi:hypothetical protein